MIFNTMHEEISNILTNFVLQSMYVIHQSLANKEGHRLFPAFSLQMIS